MAVEGVMPDEIVLTLPGGVELPGKQPVVILGPNGSGKTRESRKIVARDGQSMEFVNALRNTRISAQLPAMSQQQARDQHNSGRNASRNQPWDIVTDFDAILAQLLAEDGDSARDFRARTKAGEDATDIPVTALERAETIWREIFPGRTLSWRDWSPVISNDRGAVVSYSASQMSDGERAALYLLAKVLLAARDTVLVIDEPETHLHSLLAVRLWDGLEATRPDLRFVYVTHDLVFALSREPADFLVVDQGTQLVRVSLEEGVPLELRRDILGAASFSYYASRVVFCEGADHSYDKAILSAWFRGRDTVVVPVGSCDAVRQSVSSFNRSELLANLEAVGVVDRDFAPSAQIEAWRSDVTVLPFHEIESLVCHPKVIDCLAAHLGKTLSVPAEALVTSSVSSDSILRVAHERTKLRLRNLVEDAVTVKPTSMSEEALGEYAAGLGGELSSVSPASVLDDELALAKAAATGSSDEVLAVFPGKTLAGAVAKELGLRVDALVDLITGALSATDAEHPLFPLGQKLAEVFSGFGLPPREVAIRSAEVEELSEP